MPASKNFPLNFIKDSFIRDLNGFFYGDNYWQSGLFQQVKDLSFQQAMWKPSVDDSTRRENRHCIWEIIRHVNFWREYILACANNLETKPSVDESNWTSVPANPSAEKWKEELDRAEELQKELLDFAANMNEEWLKNNARAEAFLQIPMHDSYHAGQIGTLRALQNITPIV